MPTLRRVFPLVWLITFPWYQTLACSTNPTEAAGDEDAAAAPAEAVTSGEKDHADAKEAAAPDGDGAVKETDAGADGTASTGDDGAGVGDAASDGDGATSAAPAQAGDATNARAGAAKASENGGGKAAKTGDNGSKAAPANASGNAPVQAAGGKGASSAPGASAAPAAATKAPAKDAAPVAAPTAVVPVAKTVGQVSLQPYCESRGPHYTNLKAKDAESCAQECSDDEACRAFTHVSGWGWCFLKKADKGTIPLRFHSGARTAEGGFAPQAYDMDFPGKDLRMVAGIKDWQACAAACLAEPACKAYGYLEGIASCWLKDGVNRPLAKVFSCGVKQAATP